MKELKELRGWDRMDSTAKRLLYNAMYDRLPWYKKVFTNKPKQQQQQQKEALCL